MITYRHSDWLQKATPCLSSRLPVQQDMALVVRSPSQSLVGNRLVSFDLELVENILRDQAIHNAYVHYKCNTHNM